MCVFGSSYMKDGSLKTAQGGKNVLLHHVDVLLFGGVVEEPAMKKGRNEPEFCCAMLC